MYAELAQPPKPVQYTLHLPLLEHVTEEQRQEYLYRRDQIGVPQFTEQFPLEHSIARSEHDSNCLQCKIQLSPEHLTADLTHERLSGQSMVQLPP